EESLAIAREIGFLRFIGDNMLHLGALARYQGDLETARSRYREGIQLHWRQGGRGQLMWGLMGLGCVTVMIGERADSRTQPCERANAREWLTLGTRLLGAAERLQEATGQVVWSFDRPDHARCVAVARAGLGQEAFAVAWAEGRALSLDEVVALALEG